ncbi:4,5-DOPA dioxygenase extradiol [Thalassocella blandensis]|nr:4,5-DOPA dioxygenase extradiol [Thalassocella blandensis]
MSHGPQILFVSHGGGPLPLLGDRGHASLVDALERVVKDFTRPKAIVVISAHWEEHSPAITAAQSPDLIYDYYGFPPESYDITYPVKGDAELAQSIFRLFSQQGMSVTLDQQRGLDHGVFVPLKIMYPEADIPCVQLSLVTHLNADFHLQMGKVLSHLPDDVLVLGSGFTFHNMREFFAPASDEKQQMNLQFEHWVRHICSATEISEPNRWEALANWEAAPHARYCHPREEHLLPLHVCYGAAQRPCRHIYEAEVLGMHASLFLW